MPGSSIRPLSGKANALKRYHPADAPVVIEAERELKAAKAEQYVRQLVDAAPRLTAEQRTRLAVLLAPAPAEAVDS